MRRRDAGFALVEVLVAFAIVTIVLAALYQSVAGTYRGYARVQVREQTLALARAQLEAVGTDAPLQPGESSGTYATGVAWRLTVEPVETASYRGRAFRILLQTLDAGGHPLVGLETFKVDARAK